MGLGWCGNDLTMSRSDVAGQSQAVG